MCEFYFKAGKRKLLRDGKLTFSVCLWNSFSAGMVRDCSILFLGSLYFFFFLTETVKICLVRLF